MVRKAERKEVVMEALSTYGREGGTREDIFSLIEADLFGDNLKSKRQSLANALYRLNVEDEAIILHDGRYYLKEFDPAPQNGHTNGSTPGKHPSGNRIAVAPYAGKRDGKKVSLYKMPLVVTDAIGLELKMGEYWQKIPLFGPVRIYTGQGDVQIWHPDQETWRNVTCIRIYHKGGNTTEEPTARTDTVTLVPGE